MKEVISILDSNQMLPFLVGLGPYQLESTGDFEEPNNYEKLWRISISPFLTSANDQELRAFCEHFNDALNKLCYFSDIGLGYYTIFSHLIEYCYYINRNSRYEFCLDINKLSITVASGIESHKNLLLNDYRWAGAKWNKSFNKGYGLLGVFVEISKQMRENYNTPSFVPDDI